MSVLIYVLFLALFAVWLFGLVDVIRRKDVKGSKALYIVLMILISIVGTPLYFFKEGKKNWGWISIVLYVVTIVGYPFFIASYFNNAQF